MSFEYKITHHLSYLKFLSILQSATIYVTSFCFVPFSSLYTILLLCFERNNNNKNQNVSGLPSVLTRYYYDPFLVYLSSSYSFSKTPSCYRHISSLSFRSYTDLDSSPPFSPVPRSTNSRNFHFSLRKPKTSTHYTSKIFQVRQSIL